MAAITITDTTKSLALINSTSGVANPGLLSPNTLGNAVYLATEAYAPATQLTAGAVIAVFQFNEPITLIQGWAQASGFASSATLDVGYILGKIDTAANLVDANIQKFGAAIPIATAGQYPMMGGLASATGVPGSILTTTNATNNQDAYSDGTVITNTAPITIVARVNIGVFATTSRLRFIFMYMKNYINSNKLYTTV